MLTIISAIPCEAQAVIQHYRLKRDTKHNAFPVYRDETDQLQLIISGIGRINSAAATAYTAGISSSPTSWLNLGIAGHDQLSVGTCFLVHKLIEDTSQQSWYPGMQLGNDILTDQLTTFDQPQSEYQPGGSDMEASGFYQTALRFSPAELVQILKVVSDNPTNPTEKINKQFVSELMSKNLELITGVIDRFLELDKQQSEADHIKENIAFLKMLSTNCHFTHSQEKQCLDLLNRYAILAPKNWQDLIKTHEPFPQQKSKDILSLLNSTLSSLDSAY